MDTSLKRNKPSKLTQQRNTSSEGPITSKEIKLVSLKSPTKKNSWSFGFTTGFYQFRINIIVHKLF